MLPLTSVVFHKYNKNNTITIGLRINMFHIKTPLHFVFGDFKRTIDALTATIELFNLVYRRVARNSTYRRPMMLSRDDFYSPFWFLVVLNRQMVLDLYESGIRRRHLSAFCVPFPDKRSSPPITITAIKPNCSAITEAPNVFHFRISHYWTCWTYNRKTETHMSRETRNCDSSHFLAVFSQSSLYRRAIPGTTLILADKWNLVALEMEERNNYLWGNPYNMYYQVA